MKYVTDYIGRKHPMTAAQERQRKRAETEAFLAQKRFRKVHKTGEVHMHRLAFIEYPSVPTKVESCRWPWPRFKAGKLKMGMFFLIMGEGETAEEAVDNALKRYPKDYD